jgi:hypothetical protein
VSYRRYPPSIDWRTVVIVVLGIILLVIGLYRITT